MSRKIRSKRVKQSIQGSSACNPAHYILVVAEKPKAALRIALGLAGDSKPQKCKHVSGIPYWVVRYNGEIYVVAPAAGHLFGLYTDSTGFPVFEYKWLPLWQIEKESKHTRAYYEVFKELAAKAKAFINACDYDIEGSVIGYLIIKHFGDERRAYRAKFSTLTRNDIRAAFSKLQKLDYEMIEAGLARHELDWIWGINVSRALMHAVYHATNKHVVLSAGRVQSPTLAEAVDSDMQRKLFVPLPSYVLQVVLEKGEWREKHVLKTFDTKFEALNTAKSIGLKGYATVAEKTYDKKQITPPYPFNLGDLQSEAARLFGYSPYYTQQIAEELYLEGLISYPRTNSQKIPATIDITSILNGLSRIESYSMLVKHVMKIPNPRPRNGPKDDPAHPAIYPTGEVPKTPLAKPKWRVYDLIVRRFLASMLPPAVVGYEKVLFKLPGGYTIASTGVKLVYKGWIEAYEPYVTVEEKQLPPFTVGEKVSFKLVLQRRFTSKPTPYTKIRLVEWMEKQGLGTEGTRARIVELLFKRGYLIEKRGRVYATDLGVSLVKVLREYFPKIVSTSLTRYFEQKLADIVAGRAKREEVIAEARSILRDVLEEYKGKVMARVGVDLALSLGVIEPEKKCVICGRQAVANNMCEYHNNALKKLQEGFQEWVKRGERVDYKEYLEKLAKLRSTGEFVRDVARYEYNRLVYDNRK